MFWLFQFVTDDSFKFAGKKGDFIFLFTLHDKCICSDSMLLIWAFIEMEFL